MTPRAHARGNGKKGRTDARVRVGVAPDKARLGVSIMRLALLGIGAAASLAALAHAEPTVMYFNTFTDTTIGPEWTGTSLRHTDAANFGGFNGRYSGSDWICLTLGPARRPGDDGRNGDNNDGGGGGDGAPEFIRYTLSFDFYAIDSWDGNNASYGPDRLEVSANDVVKFSESFCNTGDTQTFREPDVGRSQMGFGNQWPEAIYRSITITHDLQPGEYVWYGWYTTQLQGMGDESWGIDNVRVSYEVVPAPGCLGLAGVGVGFLGRRRRVGTAVR